MKLAFMEDLICDIFRNGNGKKQPPEPNPFDDEDWDENDNSENVLTDNGESGDMNVCRLSNGYIFRRARRTGQGAV